MNAKYLAVVLALAMLPALPATAKAAKPRVIVNLNDTTGLTSTPVPDYPEAARRKGWDGIGLFELHFKKDGTVANVLVLIPTAHRALNEVAQTTLAQWRCRPNALSSAKITVTFQSKKSQGVVSLKDEAGEKQVGNLTYAPPPSYPFEARRQRWVGSGIFMLHFRPDGAVDIVVPTRSTGNSIVDTECESTFSKWRCLPGAYTVILVPIHFTMQGYRRR